MALDRPERQHDDARELPLLPELLRGVDGLVGRLHARASGEVHPEEVPADASHRLHERRDLVLRRFLEDADGHLVHGAHAVPGGELVLDAGRHDDDSHLREFRELELGQETHGRAVPGEFGGDRAGDGDEVSHASGTP